MLRLLYRNSGRGRRRCRPLTKAEEKLIERFLPPEELQAYRRQMQAIDKAERGLKDEAADTKDEME
jgi:hypothetical protein